MRLFYEEYADDEKWQQLVAKLPWGHNLFYHLELRCYVVVELKASEFKPEYIGQLGFYVTAVNETIKKECDASTIGLLLCRGKKRVTVEWSLKSANVPIGVSTYELKEQLPK